MNKIFLIVIFLIGLTTNGHSQDIDLYKKDKNDNYVLPKISQKMTYEEFELLSEHMRMKDMMYAVVVPGYVHFKAKENKKAYWLLGIRLASYATITAVYLSADSKYDNLEFQDLLYDNRGNYTTTLYSAIAVALATYGYDLIHGDYILHKKQEKIRFKYAVKAAKFQTSYIRENKLYPSLAFSINF